MATQPQGPSVFHDHVRFSVRDPDRELQRVRLAQEVARPRLGPEFVRFANTKEWVLLWPRPEADRMEYQIELTYADGSVELMPDPANERRADGPFGEKSVIEWPEYEPPAWLGIEAPSGETKEVPLRCRAVRDRLPAILWSSAGTSFGEPLPLLVVHDGPEFATYSGLVTLLEVMTGAGRLPPMRAALIAPIDRHQIYSASAAYSRSLVYELLPAIEELAPTPHGRRMRVGMGASLGALAMLHAHRTHAASFGGLFLQSGSFFRQRFDKYEAGFVRFRRISRFVGSVLSTAEWPQPIPVHMTCGSAEENLINNLALSEALARQGYDLDFLVNRDAHNWVGWRDALDPHLVDFLARLWA